MGSGKGVNFTLGLILKIVALLLLIVGIAIFLTTGDSILVVGQTGSADADDALNISASTYTIILIVMLGILIFKDLELDKTLAGIILIIGALLMIGCGAAVIAFSNDYYGSTEQMVSGILGLFAGCVMFIDALKSFEVF